MAGEGLGSRGGWIGKGVREGVGWNVDRVGEGEVRNCGGGRVSPSKSLKICTGMVWVHKVLHHIHNFNHGSRQFISGD